MLLVQLYIVHQNKNEQEATVHTKTFFKHTRVLHAESQEEKKNKNNKCYVKLKIPRTRDPTLCLGVGCRSCG